LRSQTSPLHVHIEGNSSSTARVTANMAKSDYILKLHPAATARLDGKQENGKAQPHTWGRTEREMWDFGG